MTELLLQCLNVQDLLWLRSTGKVFTLQSGEAFSAIPQALENIYLLLKGSCSSISDRIEYHAGNLLGLTSEQSLNLKYLQAIDESWLLAIPKDQFQQKLKDDANFAAHIYQANVLLNLEQLRSLALKNPSRSLTTYQSKHKSVTVFSELQDIDLDWLISVGRVQAIAPNSRLVQSDQPLDAMHFVLDGALAMHRVSDRRASLLQALNIGQSDELNKSTEVARLSRSDVIGEMSGINANPLNLTITAIRETMVLSVPKWRLIAKLHHDVEFASRFYRMLMLLLQDQLTSIETLDEAPLDESEDDQFLNKIALAEARFEWMLKRIQTELGRELQ